MTAAASHQRHRVLIDTDIGSDLDDALALAYLLACDDVDIVGITTATGQPDVRASLASVLLHAFVRDVDVHSGHAHSLRGDEMQPEVPQADTLDHWTHRPPASDCAAEFLVDSIRRQPGDLTVVCLAPLTNIARAIQLDPSIVDDLAGVVIMGGHFWQHPKRPTREWNILLDPDAARIVLDRCPARIVGLDVTHDVSFDLPQIETIAATSPRVRPLLDFSRAHFAKYGEVYLHDVLAAGVTRQPGFCAYTNGRVEIDAIGPQRGTSRLTATADGVHHVAHRVDADRFTRHAFDVLTSSPDRARS